MGVNLRGAEGKSTAQDRCWWGKTRKAKNYWIKQNKHKHATNLTGTEGVALHKPGVCEAKHAKQKRVTGFKGAERKALNKPDVCEGQYLM